MRYIFFGTPEFAAIILEKLIKAGFVPEAVVCNPDRPTGRKKIITAPPVKIIAQNRDIKILQPEKLEIKNLKLEIDKLGGIDFALVAAYAKIIPKAILDSLPAKFVGIHPSLLPKYRGPSPIQTVILNGGKKTGVTLYLMDEGVDSGPILAKRELENYESKIMNYGKLNKELAELSADSLIEILPRFIKGEIMPRLQDKTQATCTKKFKTEDGCVSPENLKKARNEGGETAFEIDRKIRALNPEPGTYTFINDKRIKLLEAKITGGKLKLLTIQPEGKKPMPASPDY